MRELGIILAPILAAGAVDPTLLEKEPVGGTEEAASVETDEPKKKRRKKGGKVKVAIVVGHAPDKPGARAVDGIHEHEWCDELAEKLEAQLANYDVTPKVFYRDQSGGYGGRLRRLTRKINAWEPDLVISSHFNSSRSPRSNGTEVLYHPGSEAGAEVAERLSLAIANAQGTRNRGARAQGESWAGAPLYILRDTKAPAVLLETHFGSNADDHKKATLSRDRGTTAKAIARAVTEWHHS